MTNLGEVAIFLAVTTEVKGYIDFDKGVLKLDQKPQNNLQTWVRELVATRPSGHLHRLVYVK